MYSIGCLATPFLKRGQGAHHFCAGTAGHLTGRAQKEGPIGEMHMNYKKMNGNEWAEFLVDHPEQADKCDWSKLEGCDWCFLLEYKPEFADKCNWSKLDGGDWCDLLKAQPQFADKCDWSKLNGTAWADLLSGGEDDDDLVLVDSGLSSKNGGQAAATSEFADKCDWPKLNGENWATLLSMQPQYADKCKWAKLDGYNWCELLTVKPQFADKCDWSKLDGCDWRNLLEEQPQFADKCDWLKLDNEDWNELLEVQPQFVDKRPKTKKRKGKAGKRREVYEKEVTAEVLREKKERDAAPKAVKAIFKKADDHVVTSISFCGFYPGMLVNDAKLLADHYGLQDGQWSVEPFRKKVYKLSLTPLAIRAITKCGDSFDDMAQAVANRSETLELMEDEESGLFGYGCVMPPVGQLVVISEKGDLLLEDLFLGEAIAARKKGEPE